MSEARITCRGEQWESSFETTGAWQMPSWDEEQPDTRQYTDSRNAEAPGPAAVDGDWHRAKSGARVSRPLHDHTVSTEANHRIPPLAAATSEHTNESCSSDTRAHISRRSVLGLPSFRRSCGWCCFFYTVPAGVCGAVVWCPAATWRLLTKTPTDDFMHDR